MTDLDEPNQADSTERAEAAALAEALDRDVALPDLPADALEAAAFLRFNAKDAELGAEAEARIFAELAPQLTAITTRPTPSRRGHLWVWLGPALALSAVALLWIQQDLSRKPSSLTDQHMLTSESRKVASKSVSSVVDPALRLTPTELQPWIALAESQLKQGNAAQALATIQRGLDTIPTTTTVGNAERARLLMLKAQAHEQRNELALARESYYQALQINRQLMGESLGE
jgi:tetratricopeptide (TPR) repeat protein